MGRQDRMACRTHYHAIGYRSVSARSRGPRQANRGMNPMFSDRAPPSRRWAGAARPGVENRGAPPGRQAPRLRARPAVTAPAIIDQRALRVATITATEAPAASQ
jgi:hypothetical protein